MKTRNAFTGLLPLLPVPKLSQNVTRDTTPPGQVSYGINRAAPKGPRTPDYMLHDRMRPESAFSTQRRGIEKKLNNAYIRTILDNPENRAFNKGLELARSK